MHPSTQCPVLFSQKKSLFLSCCLNSVKKLLTDALNKNQYLRRLELQQIKDIVECMYERTYQRGEYVIKQGEPGNHLFVLAGRSAPFDHHLLTLGNEGLQEKCGEFPKTTVEMNSDQRCSKTARLTGDVDASQLVLRGNMM